MTTRVNWEEARSLIETQTGPITSVRPVSDGRNAQIAVIVETAMGTTFVKGLRSDHKWIQAQSREQDINPYVQTVSPRLLWSLDAEGWNLLGFEYVHGRAADLWLTHRSRT